MRPTTPETVLMSRLSLFPAQARENLLRRHQFKPAQCQHDEDRNHVNAQRFGDKQKNGDRQHGKHRAISGVMSGSRLKLSRRSV